MLRPIHPVRHVERLAQDLGLVVEVGARHVLRDLLQESDVGRFLTQEVDGSLQLIPAVDAANALVDVPGNDAK